MSKSYWEKGPLAITNIFCYIMHKGFKVIGQGHKGQNLNYPFFTFQVKVTGSRSRSQGHKVKNSNFQFTIEK